MFLLCVSRPVRPLYRRLTTPSLYALTPAMSTPISSALMPNCSLSRVWSAISAACSSAFVGMHPRCRQVPPSSALSIRATERFSSAARRAAAYPPLPAPRITMSKVFGWLTSTPRSRRHHVGHTMETVTSLPGHLVTCGADQCSQVPHDVRCRSTLAALEREERHVAWFRRRQEPGRTTGRPADRADLEHLAEFVRSRRGVEAFIEPRTTVTETTVLLVAHDGEWPGRRIDSPEGPRRFAHQLSMPIYDVRLMGYPRRMRDYNARQKKAL